MPVHLFLILTSVVFFVSWVDLCHGVNCGNSYCICLFSGSWAQAQHPSRKSWRWDSWQKQSEEGITLHGTFMY